MDVGALPVGVKQHLAADRTMKRICPNPMPWHKVSQALVDHARSHSCTPSSPPTPLILAGWAYSTDAEKLNRWEETLAWAERNGCSNVTASIGDSDFYCVDSPAID